jgi:RimJ/RimL family protein N-acetyltransferase
MKQFSFEDRKTQAPELETERLRLRHLKDDDVQELWSTLGRADVMAQYVDFIDQSAGWPLDKVNEFIKSARKSWAENGLGPWGLENKSTSTLTGYCGLDILDYLPTAEPEVEFSFFVHPNYWGEGLGPEAAGAVFDWAFADLGIDSLVACVVTDNIKSIRALGKLGLTYEQTLPYHSAISGRDAKFEVHRIHGDEWQKHKNIATMSTIL